MPSRDHARLGAFGAWVPNAPNNATIGSSAAADQGQQLIAEVVGDVLAGMAGDGGLAIGVEVGTRRKPS